LRHVLKWIALRCGLALCGVIAALLLGEALIRLGFVLPNHQVIRGKELHALAGVPVWRDSDSEPRENRSCVDQHPERLRILFFGTSITFGGAVRPEETFPRVLEAELNRRRPTPGFCVLNFAQPAFAFEQRYAVASQELPRYHPALALEQDWMPGSGGGQVTYTMLGDAAYELGNLHLRADGMPGLRGVPDAVNRALFLHSRLYEWLTLADGERGTPHGPPPDLHAHEHELEKMASLIGSNGARPGFFLVPDLSYPLTTTSEHDKQWAQTDVELGRLKGFAVYPLRPRLTDQDNTRIRLDSWHLNASGHHAVGERLVPFILEMLDSPPAQDATTPSPR
jgi:hypothetical protein